MEFARADEVLTIQESTTQSYAAIKDDLCKKGNPISENDVLIAAIALENGCPIVSQDSHFDVIPQVQRIGWRSRFSGRAS